MGEVNITKQKHRFEVSLPSELAEVYQAAAESVGISLPAWTKMAMAAYYAKWKAPEQMRQRKGGKDLTAGGMECTTCGGDASLCRLPEKHKAWGEWTEKV